MKNFVGRISGRKDPSAEALQPPVSQNKAPRKEQSQRDQAAPERAPESSGGKRNRRRKAKPAPAPWSIDQFVVEPAEDKVRFHDLGLRDELTPLARRRPAPAKQLPS